MQSAPAIESRKEARGPVLGSAFDGLRREHPFESLRVEGRLPAALEGTFVRNGPAVFDSGVEPHWFDGAGAIAAVRIADGAAKGAVRVVRSPSADHDRGRVQNRFAAFGQRMSIPQRLRALFGAPSVRNLANINILPWQERLFALYEASLPVELDPETFTSIGETDLGGVIRGAWNAHPRRVPARRATYQFGLRIGPRCFLDVDELPDAGPARRLTSIPLPGVTEIHDVFATERHLVFVLTPWFSSSLRLVWTGSFVEALVHRPNVPCRVLVVPLDEPARVVQIEADPFFFWHGLNAYEKGSEIVLDLVRYPDFQRHNRWIVETVAGRDGGPHRSSVARGVIDLRARTARFEEIHGRPCEFPVTSAVVHARPHRFAWMAGFAKGNDTQGGWFDRLVRIDVESGDAREIDPGPRVAVAEPILVQRSSREDDVWVLSLVRDLGRDASFLGVWDGATMDSEPVARIWFDQLLPPALHGCWIYGRGGDPSASVA